MNAIDTAVWKLAQWFSEHICRSPLIKTVIPAAAHAPEKITPHVICHQKIVVMGTEYGKPKDKCTHISYNQICSSGEAISFD